MHSQWDWAPHGTACWPAAAGSRTGTHSSFHTCPSSHTVVSGPTGGREVGGVPWVPWVAEEAPPKVAGMGSPTAFCCSNCELQIYRAAELVCVCAASTMHFPLSFSFPFPQRRLQHSNSLCEMLSVLPGLRASFWHSALPLLHICAAPPVHTAVCVPRSLMPASVPASHVIPSGHLCSSPAHGQALMRAYMLIIAATPPCPWETFASLLLDASALEP